MKFEPQSNHIIGPYNAQRLLAESPERLTRRNMLVAKKKALVEGLQCLGEHFEKFQTQNTSESDGGDSNYQRPAVHTPLSNETEVVNSAGLPFRSMSR